MEESKSELFGMNLDYDGGYTLQETVRWSRFLAVVGMVAIGVLVIALLVVGPQLAQLIPGLDDFLGLLISVCLILLIVSVAAVVFLYRFSTLTRRGIDTQDQSIFNRGLFSLKVYFLICGVFGVLFLLLNIYTTVTTF